MRIELDAKGLACPKPVINTKKKLDSIEQGVVEVTVDNEIAKANILKLSAHLISSKKPLLLKVRCLLGFGFLSRQQSQPRTNCQVKLCPVCNLKPYPVF